MLQRTTPPRAENPSSTAEKFMKYKPPEFSGGYNPRIAKNWIGTLERLFNCAKVPDSEKVHCAACLLRDDASYWWDTMTSIHDIGTMTWAEFRKLIENKYVTVALVEEKEREFLNLRRGNMTMEELLRKFDELSRYAPHMVATNTLKVKHFKMVLDSDTRKDLEIADLDDAPFSKVADKAIRIDRA